MRGVCINVTALATVLATVLAFGLVREAHAAGSLLDEVRYQDKGDYAQLEIRLGIEVQIAGDPEVDAESLKFQLTPIGQSRQNGWSSAEMSFDEADRLLKRVMIEGNGQNGYALIVDFSEAVTAQLLPQFDDNQVLLKIAPLRDRRKASRPSAPPLEERFAINLESRREALPELQDIPRSFADSHSVYVTEFEKDGARWHRLRMGFFATQQQAESTAARLRQHFPDAWVLPVTDTEIQFAESFKINPEEQIARFSRSPAIQPASETEATPEVVARIQLITPSTISGEAESEPAEPRWEERAAVQPAPLSDIEQLAADARSAFESRDYDDAIRLYTKLLGLASGELKQQALEMLGVSRELNRQLAHSKLLYQTYLREYPDTLGALRVQQRLAGLLALEQAPRKALKQITGGGSQDWQVASHLSQFYQRHSLKVEDNSSVPINGLFNDFNLIASKDGASLQQEARLTMSYLWDFSGQDRLKGREFQVSSGYWEGFSDRFNSGIKVGRQSRLRSGVPGRFDGASFTYQQRPNLAFDLTAGFLVDSSFDAPNTNRPFVGVSGEYISKSGNITIEPFFMQQYVDGILDRRAVGTQAQLFTERAMIYSLIDYDIHHSALNNVTFSGNVQVGSSQVSASYEHRKSPYLTTRNALIGQSYDDLSELEQSILDLELKDIANDRTATSNTIRVGLNSRLSQRWAVSADVVAADFSSTETSADVIGMQSQKMLYSSIQVRSNEVFGRASYSAVMVRRAESSSGATTSLYWDNRFGLGDRLRVYPRIRLDRRNFDSSGDKQWSVRPSLRVDYRQNRRLRFEVEVGYTRTTRAMASRDLDITGLYLRAGYRASF